MDRTLPSCSQYDSDITIKFSRFSAGCRDNFRLPTYFFTVVSSGERVGEVIFRNSQKSIVAEVGHIGFYIDESHRGNNLAYEATLQILPFIRLNQFRFILIVCSPSNIATQRIAARLGAQFSGEHLHHAGSEMYALGYRKYWQYVLHI